MNTELATVQSPALTAYEPRSLDEATRLASLLYASGLTPRALAKPEAILYALIAGRELGLSATQALRSLHIIDGKVVLSADLIVGMVKRSPLCRFFRMVESTGERAAYETLREGDPEPTRLSYTMAQAKEAGLAGKQNWKSHPDAMLRARCSAALARAVYPDLAMGLFDTDEGEEIAHRATEAPPRQVSVVHAEPEPATPTALADYLSTVASAPSAWAVWAAYTDLPDALRAEGLDPAVDAPGARDAAALRLRALGLLLSAAEVQALLGAQDAGDLARALDGVRALPARDPAAAARWWVAARGSLPRAAAALCYTVAARRCVGAEVIDAGTTRAGKTALSAAVALADAPPPGGGGAPVPEAPQETVVTSDGTTLSTEPEMRAHLEGLTHPRAVEASWRKHRACERYALLAVERYAALVGTDCDTALRALEGGARVRRAA